MDWQDALSAPSSRGRRIARRLLPWAFRIVTAINVCWLAVLALAYVIPLPGRDDGWSTVVEYRDGRPAHVFLSPDEKWRLLVAIDAVDPKLVESLVMLEDKRFWSHDGVDSLAIVRAAWTDLTRGRRVSGGSTLSMQLARLLEPRPRTITNKLVDMFRAVQLDLRLSKHEILSQYLSRTPYGANVEGVESAAWSYFGHGARHLTPLEIATLLAVPQGPGRYAPSPANRDRLRARRDEILRKLIDNNVFAAVDARAALADATPPPDHLTPMPRDAPHAAVALRKRFPKLHAIRSTLDAGVQALVETEVQLHVEELRRKGIFNGAVVVVDHRTRDVVALVGNLDFTDAKHGGQIAMFERPRSPGSTLKPLLYSLAIDRGIALPDYLVADVPTQYGTYRPKNFDGDWAGLVTLRDALSRSLNLPFIDLMNELGVRPFIAELAHMDVRAALADTPTGEFGLSLIVGGIELTPLELAGLYATLAENGVYQPLRLVGSAGVRPQTIYGPGAAWLTREALAIKDRPDFPRRRTVNGMPAAIHWKTGTSFGFRDAWAVGSGPAYTAVVWTGNVDNKPSADLIGSEAAGPLLFDVLEGVANRSHAPVVVDPPDDLALVEVCAYSGHIPGAACDHRTKVLAPLHAVPTVPCPYHQAFEVDHETREAVLPACRAGDRTYDRKSFLVLPSAVNAWLVERNRAVPEGPMFAASCTNADAQAAPPIIKSPTDGQIVMLLAGVPAKQQQVPLVAMTRATTLSWFVDGALVATAPSSERQHWIPSVGKHEIVVTDDAGRKARRSIEVTQAASQRAR